MAQASRVWRIKADFTGTDAVAVDATYSTTNIGAGLEHRSNGAEAITDLSFSGEIWTSSASADQDRGKRPPNGHQYSVLKVVTAAGNFTGVVCGAASASEFYLLDFDDPSVGTRKLRRFDFGTPTTLATGGSGAVNANDTLELEVRRGAWKGGRNGVGEVSHTDTTYLGPTGVFCYNGAGVAMLDDFEAGTPDVYVPATRHRSALDSRRAFFRRNVARRRAVARM